jgi:hypothetical protein
MEKMKIFVSWSGPRSAAVAEALKEYLPIINNAFDLWLSSEDITKGSRSTLEIAKALVSARAGIICLTPNNLTSPWILFEAGSIAKQVDNPLACTLLIGLEPSDVTKPLGEFQHTRLKQKELLQLVKNLNSAAGENARKESEIEKAFAMCWPELKAKLDTLPIDGPTGRPERKPEDLLEELVDLARTTSSEVSEMNQSIRDELKRTTAAIQNQIEYLGKIPPPSTLLSPTLALLGEQEKLTANQREALDKFFILTQPPESANHPANRLRRAALRAREMTPPPEPPEKK